MVKREDLEAALSGSIPDVSNRNIWIWGAGNTSQLYQEGLGRLQEQVFFKGGGRRIYRQ